MKSRKRHLVLFCFGLGLCGLLIAIAVLRHSNSSLSTFSTDRVATPQSLPLSLFAPIQSEKSPQTRVREAYRKLPLSFEANHGQATPEVKFTSRGFGYKLILTSIEARLKIRSGVPKAESGSVRFLQLPIGESRPPSTTETVLRMKFLGTNPESEMVGLENLPGKVNYLLGKNPASWRTNIPTYSKVKYSNLYAGIDLIYYGNQGKLEYDFVVAPGADPKAISVLFDGMKEIELTAEGELRLRTVDAEVRHQKPTVYQEINGVRHQIQGSYILRNHNQVGFDVPEYDTTKPLIIDPIVVYSTYLGGSDLDRASGVAVDGFGSTYVTGETTSADFPLEGAVQSSIGGNHDVFVAKFNAAGSALIYCTYLGGNGEDLSNDVAIDESGAAFITGRTTSSDFPLFNALQPIYQGGGDVFVTKINPSGSAFVYSTYLGGSESDFAEGIEIDSSGNAYIGGTAVSSNFPTTSGAFQRTRLGISDAIAVKLDHSGTSIIYSTFLGGGGPDLGGGGRDIARDIALDTSGNVYLVGETNSSNFPTTPNAFQTSYAGSFPEDAFVTKLNPTGSELVYSTYLGGSRSEEGRGIDVDASGCAYVIGDTVSLDFPVANAVQPFHGNPDGGLDAFVTKLDPTGSTLVYSTYLGGGPSGAEFGFAIAVDSFGSAYITGLTNSFNFPTRNPLQQQCGGNGDIFVAKLNPNGSAFVYSTYICGSGDEEGNSIAVDASGNTYVVGITSSANFPTLNAFQSTDNGQTGAFLLKLATPPDSTSPIITISAPSSTNYILDEPVAASFFCTDENSGIDSCLGSVLDGSPIDTATVGTHTFTVSATDIAGNAATQSISYLVTYKIFLMYNSGSAFSSKSKPQIKIQLQNTASLNVSSATIAVTPVRVTPRNIPTITIKLLSGNFLFDPNLHFQGAAGGGGYKYELDASGIAKGDYDLIFNVAGDPILHIAPFAIK